MNTIVWLIPLRLSISSISSALLISLISLIVVALMFGLMLWMMAPRSGRKKRFAPYKETYIAHRGLHKKVPYIEGEPTVYPKGYVPENTIKAFREAVNWGFGIELDVQMSTDGKLVVFHDEDLVRMCGDERTLHEKCGNKRALHEKCGNERVIHKMSWSEIQKINLAGTNEKIPTFKEVLDLVDGKVPLMIEIKPEGDSITTTRLTCEMLDNYKGEYCIKSFSPLVLRWVRKNRPNVLRGQLATNFKKNNMPLPFGTKWIFSNMLLNFLSRPDFISYNHLYKNHFGYWLIKKIFNPINVAWTIRNNTQLNQERKDFDIFIFDSFNPKEKRNMIDLLRKRRSIRTYNEKEITEVELNKILQAALLSPTGRNKQPAEFIVVKDKEVLAKLSESRTHGSQLIKGANVAIVVIGDSELSDTWIEDCSIAMTSMQLAATQQNIGNCWVQVRGRYLEETNEKTEDIIKKLLDIPDKYSVESMLALGKTDEEWGVKDMPDPQERRIHISKF